MKKKIIPCTFDRYEISEDGVVYDLLCNREIAQCDSYGYLRVNLETTTGRRSIGVNRLVAVAFVPGRSLERNVVNHRNRVKHDNRAENLAWVTYHENRLWQGGNYVSGIKNGMPVVAYDPETGLGIGAWSSQHAAARELGISQRGISDCIHGRRQTCGGYAWRAV